jgi:hypothetical protein
VTPPMVSSSDERGLANWPAMRPTFTTGSAAGVGQHDRHLQQHAEGVADIVGMELGEAFGAVAALQQEGLALGDLAEAGFQVARFAGKHQRRMIRLPCSRRASAPDG